MDIQSELLTEVEAFLTLSNMAPTTFGRAAVNDGNFVPRLRQRRNMDLRTIDRVREFLRTQAMAVQ